MRMVTVVALSSLVLFAAVAGASEFGRPGDTAGFANANSVSRGYTGRAFSLGNAASEFQAGVNAAPAATLRFTADAPAVGIPANAYMQFPTGQAKQFSAFAQGESIIGKVMGAVPQDLSVEARRMPRGTARSMLRYSGDKGAWFGTMQIFNTTAPGPQALANPQKAGAIVDDPAMLGLTVVSRD